MSTRYKQLHTTLRANGYSVTKARRLVFELFIESPPMSMRELISKAKGQIDRVSIYRIVTLFEELNIIHRITIGWKYKLELSDQFTPHHHHLSCLRCHAVIALKDTPAIEEYIATLSEQHQFHLVEHQLELQGYCQNCQNDLD